MRVLAVDAASLGRAKCRGAKPELEYLRCRFSLLLPSGRRDAMRMRYGPDISTDQGKVWRVVFVPIDQDCEDRSCWVRGVLHVDDSCARLCRRRRLIAKRRVFVS